MARYRAHIAGAVLIAGSMAFGAPAQAKDRPATKTYPHLFWSWIADTRVLMTRCGTLQRLHAACGIAGGVTEADRLAVQARWLRQGFRAANVNRLMGFWIDARTPPRAPRKNPFTARTPDPVKPPAAAKCRAAGQMTTLARAVALCRGATVYCLGKPCDPNRLPRRLPWEIRLPTGMSLQECGSVEAQYERCGIGGVVDAALRRAAFERLRAEGFDRRDIAWFRSYWMNGYGEAMREPPPDKASCAAFGEPKERRRLRSACGRIAIYCTPGTANGPACDRFKPRR